MTAYLENFPGENQTVMAKHSALTIGGKGLNQAVAAARAGGQVTLIGCIGDDVFGGMAQEYLKKNKVDTSCLKKVKGVATGTANILVTDDGDNMIAVAPGANASLSPEDIMGHKELIQSSDILIVQLEVSSETVRTALELAAEGGVATILNPAPALKSAAGLVALADIITPNETETRDIVGVYPCDSETAGIAAGKLREAGAKNIIITMGEGGYFYAADGRESHVPSFKVDVLDPTGAGDVFNGVLAVALCRGNDPARAAQYAAAAGALSVMKAAAEGAAPTWQEIEEFLQQNIAEDNMLT